MFRQHRRSSQEREVWWIGNSVNLIPCGTDGHPLIIPNFVKVLITSCAFRHLVHAARPMQRKVESAVHSTGDKVRDAESGVRNGGQ